MTEYINSEECIMNNRENYEMVLVNGEYQK
jgi:hypothetical protein